jgi:hypothetical protein
VVVENLVEEMVMEAMEEQVVKGEVEKAMVVMVDLRVANTEEVVTEEAKVVDPMVEVEVGAETEVVVTVV